MVDLKAQYLTLKVEIDKAIQQVCSSGRFILGENLQRFEQEAADYLGVNHAIGVASGTDALYLSLLAAGIGVGDEVITTPFTFIATAEAISYTGATPVLVDIDAKTFNIDLDQVAQAITPNTGAIVPVHIFGQPVNMPVLRHLCDQHGLMIIEDCAQSFGAHIDEKMTGSFGTLGAYSFYPSKNLGCFGDGGLVTTNDQQLADTVHLLRNHGSNTPYRYHRQGYNSRLDELQAAILRIKLRHIDTYNQQRRQIAQRYSHNLGTTGLELPDTGNQEYHVFHQYTLLSENRDKIIAALDHNHIASGVFYPIPLHRQPVYQNKFENISLPISEATARKCLSLPIYPELAMVAIDKISNVIKENC